jgi:hypothetical protein
MFLQSAPWPLRVRRPPDCDSSLPDCDSSLHRHLRVPTWTRWL